MDDDEPIAFQHQAFEICTPDFKFDPNIPPTNGNEYLTHMYYEREQYPAVVSIKCDNLSTSEHLPLPQEVIYYINSNNLE